MNSDKDDGQERPLLLRWVCNCLSYALLPSAKVAHIPSFLGMGSLHILVHQSCRSCLHQPSTMHFPLLCKLMSIIYQILIIYIYSVPRCHISAGLCEVTSMCLFLCHLSCVPKRHLLAVSGEVLWLIVKLCGGTCTRASTAVCHGDSTRSLYSEWKLFWKWYTIQNLLLHRNTCFPESSHKPRVLPLAHRTGS